MINIIIISLIGYLIGSIPCSFLVSKFIGKIDIREHGSGNTGATNVFRVLGKKAAYLAFAGDFAKGILATLVGLIFFNSSGALLCSAMAIIGHCYPIWTNFKGGKGIATSAGMIFTLTPIVGLSLLVLHFSVLFLTKTMSKASLTSALSYPLLVFIFAYPLNYVYYAVFLSAFVIYRHKDNIKKILTGNENKILK